MQSRARRHCLRKKSSGGKKLFIVEPSLYYIVAGKKVGHETMVTSQVTSKVMGGQVIHRLYSWMEILSRPLPSARSSPTYSQLTLTAPLVVRTQ